MPTFAKLKKGGWSVRFRAKNSDGENVKHYLSPFETKEDAQKAMIEYMANLNKGVKVDSKVLLKDYLARFFEDYVIHNVGSRTKRRYGELIQLHISPELGDHQLGKLKAGHIQSFYTKKINSGLSTTTVLYMHRVLHLALFYAVKWEYISFNPCDGVKAPRKNQVELTIPTDAEIKQLLDVLADEASFIAVYIAVSTGMRLGEVTGLQNSDVDINKECFNIHHGYQRVNGEMTLDKCKTHRSKRPVSFLPGTKEIVQKYVDKKREWVQTYAGVMLPSNHFCVWPDGSPVQPEYLSKSFKRACRKLGLSEEITFHTLRHYHASWLLRQGVNPKIVSERLGHTSVNITLNTYSHLLEDTQKDVLSQLKANFIDVE